MVNHMENSFEIRDLNLYYGDKQALKSINMDISRYEVSFHWSKWLW